MIKEDPLAGNVSSNIAGTSGVPPMSILGQKMYRRAAAEREDDIEDHYRAVARKEAPNHRFEHVIKLLKAIHAELKDHIDDRSIERPDD